MDVEGNWSVRRVSGLLPPGVTKQIGPRRGWTKWFGVPMGAFAIEGSRFVYRLWPVVDELERAPDGGFVGTGRIFGVPFCRFRLEPRAPRLLGSRLREV